MGSFLFCIGFLIGASAIGIMASMATVTMLHQEWRERRSLKSRVDELYYHLACGQGYVGCKGGLRCNSDHK